MTFDEYQHLAARTINYDALKPIGQEQHALHGMVSEIGELHGIYQKTFQGHPFDMEHAMKEVGDLLWFVAEWCTASGIRMDAIAGMNIEKLRKRYPHGFTEEDSLHRAAGDI